MSVTRPTLSQQRARYEDLTNPELIGMEVGVKLLLEGEVHRAHRVIQISLDVEHFIAGLDFDPMKVTEAERTELLELRDQLVAISGVQCPLNVLGEIRAPIQNAEPADDNPPGPVIHNG